MAEAIAKAILTEGLKKLIGSITAKRYDDAANIVKDLRDAIDAAAARTVSETKWALGLTVYNEHLSTIKTWSERYQRALEKKNAKSTDQSLDQLIKDMNNNTNGIHTVLTKIDGLLTRGPSAAASQPGLIYQFCDNLSAPLCDTKDFEMTIYKYLDLIDRFLSEAIAWQVVGNALRIACAEDADDMSNYKAEWDRTRQRQIEYTWQSLHPLMRTLKKDYFSKMDSEQYYNLICQETKEPVALFEAPDNVPRRHRILQLDGKSGFATQWFSEWKFVPALDMPSNWDRDDGGQRKEPSGISYVQRPDTALMRAFVNYESGGSIAGFSNSSYKWTFFCAKNFSNRDNERRAPVAIKVTPLKSHSDLIQLIPTLKENAGSTRVSWRQPQVTGEGRTYKLVPAYRGDWPKSGPTGHMAFHIMNALART